MENKFAVRNQLTYSKGIEFPHNFLTEKIDGLSKLTVQAWVRNDGGNTRNGRVHAFYSSLSGGTNNLYKIELSVSNTGNAVFGGRRTYTDSYNTVSGNIPNFQLGKFYHLTGTIDLTTGEAKLYVNGELLATGTAFGSTGVFVNGSGIHTPRTLSHNYSDTDYADDGMVDDLRFWNRVLTSDEIRRNYNQYLNGNETGLIALYRFDEGSGLVTKNEVNTAYNGTLPSASMWVPAEFDLYRFRCLIKSDNKYYTFRDYEFEEVSLTELNFKEKDVNLTQLVSSTNQSVLTMGDGEILGDGKVYRKIVDINFYTCIEKVDFVQK